MTPVTVLSPIVARFTPTVHCVHNVRSLSLVGMTRPAATADDGVIPAQTFGVRIAIVRAVLGLNYDQLSRACGALGTPIHSETLRRWEHHTRQCANPDRVARVLSKIQIPGTEHLPERLQHIKADWILNGGEMPAEVLSRAPGPEQEALPNWREAATAAA